MSRRHRGLILCFIALLVMEQTVSATIIVPVSQDRRAETSVTGFSSSGQIVSDSETVVAPDFGPFDDSASAAVALDGGSITGTATHSSTIGDFGIFATGQASVATANNLRFLSGTSSARFDLTFDLLVPVDYLLSVSFNADFDDDGNRTHGSATLSDSSGVIFSAELPPQANDGGGSEGGTLFPGRYTFQVSAAASEPESSGVVGNSSGYSLFFDITPLPEPSTLLLVSLGLLGLTARRSRANRPGREVLSI